MESIFLGTYRFFKKNRAAFWLAFIITLGLLTWGAYRIDLEEDITKFFPDDERVQKLNYIFENSAFAEKVVVMVSVADSSQSPIPDSLVAEAERLVPAFEEGLQSFKSKVNSKIDDEKILEVFDIAHAYLPVFLNNEDYRVLDSLTQPKVSRTVIQKNYQQLISPTGVVLKKIIVRDPMGFSYLVLQKLQQLQYDDNFQLYDNYILTKDKRHLVFFIETETSSGETGKNTAFVGKLEQIVDSYNAQNRSINVSCFGATMVAVGNANILRKDTILTLSILIIFLAVFITGFFRNVWALFYILMPAIFGALFALSCIYFIKGSVSILALAAGSVILGIAVNYALHFLVHLRHHPNHEQVIKDLVAPMTLGSTTTVLAFFSLQFTNAAVLKDVGLFAGFSLIGAALCALIFLPHFLRIKPHHTNAIEKLPLLTRRPGNKWVLVIFLLTPVFFYFARDVKFNSDMSSLNFMSAETREAQQRLETINPASLQTVYVSSEGKSMEAALRNTERTFVSIDSLKATGLIGTYHSVTSFLLSDSLQRVRIKRWNDFWTNERKTAFYRAVHHEGTKLRFAPHVLNNIDSLVEKKYTPVDDASFNILQKTFFKNNIISKNGEVSIVSMLNVMPSKKKDVYAALENQPAHAFDKQMITNLFVEFVHDDFSFIVAFTSILVFVVLLISSGRIEITVITFMPMLITWIWILGIMALLGIEFNIINVMISTFIFGLGDDYSIFVMDGLQQEYKTGKVSLPSVRTSIFLSAVTTISGLGVLIFASHPALRSIAAIAIIGIVCVFIMSQTIEPFLFAWLVTNRTKAGLPPRTILGMIFTCITYFLFIFGSFLLTAIGILLRSIPFARKTMRLAFHHVIRAFNVVIIYVALCLKKKFIGRNRDLFSRPSVMIANHSSFLDILVIASLHPKLILLTNKWVWNSPIFGGVVRLADYYPVMEGAEESVQRLQDRVKEGYTIVVFPEGTRSKDGKIHRFHKGAFYLAEQLRLPILPLLICGASEGIPKNTKYLNEINFTLKFLPKIEPDDLTFGTTYSERTKAISKHFKDEFKKLQLSELTPRGVRFRVISNYLYKGPVLEWYMRVKLQLENYYQVFDELVPKRAAVLDLGCGYGFLSYTLKLVSEERTIIGVDYDAEKIEVAQNGYLRSEQLQFYCADVNTFEWGSQDVIIISDVLHYLLPEQQTNLLQRCFDSLNPGGKVIIRDGNADLQERHRGTKLTELFSVKLLGFNKSVNGLNFVSGKALTEFAGSQGLSVEILDHGKFTSNIIFVVSKEKQLHAAL